MDSATVIKEVKKKQRLGLLGGGDVIFGSLLALIGLAAVLLGSIEPRWEVVFESAIFLLGTCVFLTDSVGQHWRVPFLLAPVAGLLLIACLQTLPLWSDIHPNIVPRSSQTISVDPVETNQFIIKFLAAALALALLLRYTTNRKRLLALAHLVMIVGVVSGGFGILRRLLPDLAPDPTGTTQLHGIGFGQFASRNHFALLMEMSLGPTLSLAFYVRSRARRFLYCEICLLICVSLVLTNSRGGITGMMGQFAFLSWLYFGAALRGSLPRRFSSTGNSPFWRFWQLGRAFAIRCVLVLFLLGIVSAGVLLLGGESVRERLESVPAEFQARRDGLQQQNPRRLEIWIATLRMIEDYPLLGSGLGAYQTAATDYLRSEGNWQPQQAHNEYLELMAGGGVAAAAMVAWFILILIRESRKRLLDHDPLRRVLCGGALIGLVGVGIHSLVDFGLHPMANTIICCALIALATTKVESASIRSSSAVC